MLIRSGEALGIGWSRNILYSGLNTLPRSVLRRQTGFAARITRTLSRSTSLHSLFPNISRLNANRIQIVIQNATQCTILMPDPNKPIGKMSKTRYESIVIAWTVVSVLSVPLFLLLQQLESEPMLLMVPGILGGVASFYSAPINIYVGLRTGSRLEWLCGLIALCPIPFWLWIFITN